MRGERKSEEEEDVEKLEKEIEEAYEKKGREAVRELMEEIRRKDPILALLAARGVLKAIKAEYRRAYQAQRLQLRITISPKERVLFEACRDFCYSKGWLKQNTNRAFLRFCVERTVDSVLKKMEEEDAALLRGEEKLRS